MSNKRIPLEPDKYYHIYNHGNGTDNIFKSDENYYYFLEKFAQHISPVCDTFAYCLMPNHFHFLVRIKSENELMELFALKNPQGFINLAGLLPAGFFPDFISQQYSNFFNAYTKAFNNQQERKGSLFLDNFRRIQVDTKEYFQKLIHYIHYNPVHHGFVKRMDDWKHSSYHSLLSTKTTLLKRDEVIEWFNDIENFKTIHRNKADGNLFLDMEF